MKRDALSGLDSKSLSLLLCVLETEESVIAGSVIEDHHSVAGRALIDAGLLVPSGYEEVDASQADHDDAPVPLRRLDDGGFGYFSPAAGWVRVPASRLTRFRVMPEQLAQTLGVQFGIPRGMSTMTLVAGHLWEIGPARIGRRRHATTILFGRRLGHQAIWRQCREALLARPSAQPRVLLTSTSRERIEDALPGGVRWVWLPDILVFGGGLRIDKEILSARLDGMTPRQPAGPVEVFGDGKEVRLFGRVFRIPKGVQQRRIVCYLHQQLLLGIRRVPPDKIVVELDLPPKARIRDYFKRSPLWGALLSEKDGMIGFCLDDEQDA
ncbi:MAG: hypothetical protein AB7N54_19595 [Alphaproteobacteria bacterium]